MPPARWRLPQHTTYYFLLTSMMFSLSLMVVHCSYRLPAFQAHAKRLCEGNYSTLVMENDLLSMSFEPTNWFNQSTRIFWVLNLANVQFFLKLEKSKWLWLDRYTLPNQKIYTGWKMKWVPVYPLALLPARLSRVLNARLWFISGSIIKNIQ